MPRSSDRRTFIRNATLATAGLALIGCDTSSKLEEARESIKPLKILILGGTSFLGPHQIAYALDRGHSISTFTRGQTRPTVHADVFDRVEMLIGDRNDNLLALKNRKWDVVIDNSGRDVQWTKDTAELLKDHVGQYIYTSSTGVYFPYLKDDIKEDVECLTEMPAGTTDEILKMEYGYGVMKRNSELAAIAAFGADRTLIVRPTYMIGPGDNTDRFIYWPVRLAQGGDILVPGKPDDAVQYADVRDVAEWTIRMAEIQTTGSFNIVGPRETETIKEFASNVQHTFDVASTLVHIDDLDFLTQEEIFYIVPWIISDKMNYGSARVNNDKALGAGLTLRDVKTSIKEIYAWWSSDVLTDERRDRYLKDPKGIIIRSAEVMEKWKAR